MSRSGSLGAHLDEVLKFVDVVMGKRTLYVSSCKQRSPERAIGTPNLNAGRRSNLAHSFGLRLLV